jgi:hypothetical protein
VSVPQSVSAPETPAIAGILTGAATTSDSPKLAATIRVVASSGKTPVFVVDRNLLVSNKRRQLPLHAKQAEVNRRKWPIRLFKHLMKSDWNASILR